MGSSTTPWGLARLTGVQALGAIAETLLFGMTGFVFAILGLAIVDEASGNGYFEHLMTLPNLAFYLLASALVYVSLLTAVRVGNESGINPIPDLETEERDSLIDQVYNNILSILVGSSYTAAVIGIGGIVAYEAAQLSPVLGMVAIVAYPYVEHYAIVRTAEGAESVEEVDVILTPAIVVTMMIVIVPTIIISPILLSLRVIGIVASIWAYLPSLSGMGQSIRATQEHLVILDWLSASRRHRFH